MAEETGNPVASGRPLLLGHRGARANKPFPENTIASFDQALADGCDGFEFDVRLTADGEAVICHDARVVRASIAKSIGEKLPDLPRLEQVLKRYQHHAFLNIELKVRALERLTSSLLRKYPPTRGCIVSSFLPAVVKELFTIDPAMPLGLICETRLQLQRSQELPVGYAMLHFSLANRRTINQIHDAGKKSFVWTVNRASTAKKFADWGIDGIISDDTKMLGRLF